MDEKEILVPVQPYLSLDADDYKEIIPRRMGISNFMNFMCRKEHRQILRQCRMTVRILFWYW